MIELPRTLAPWASQLELFPDDVALSLGHWLPRIDALVGPLRSTPVDEADPDGFDGITQRGRYERLLASEWLFADVAPDEFIRRAATGEHSFLRLGYQSPASAARCFALFDAGWEQLGAPRLAHVALLVALARRAHAAGVALHWGVVQAVSHLHEGLSKPGVRALLDARTSSSATAAQIDDWWEAAAPEPDDDVWLIGGEELMALSGDRGGARIAVREEGQPRPRRLHLEVRGPRQHGRRTVLDLPEESAAIRVLRHPFDAQGPAQGPRRVPRFDDCDALIIAPGRRRLIGRVRNGLIAAHIPTSSLDEQGRSRYFNAKDEEPIVGVAYQRKKLIVATLRGSTIALYMRNRGDGPATSVYTPAPNERVFAHDSSPSRLRLIHTGENAYNLVDDEQNLIALPGWPSGLEAHYYSRLQGVVAMGPDGSVLVRHGDEELHLLAGTNRIVPPEHRHDTHRFASHGWRGRAIIGRDIDELFLAALDYGDHWMVATPSRRDRVVAPEGQVLGASATCLGLGLILLEPDRRALRHVGPNDDRVIVRLRRPARCATMSNTLIGWVDDDGQPYVWCTRQNHMVLEPHKEDRS